MPYLTSSFLNEDKRLKTVNQLTCPFAKKKIMTGLICNGASSEDKAAVVNDTDIMLPAQVDRLKKHMNRDFRVSRLRQRLQA